jgi:hypothetical protein
LTAEDLGDLNTPLDQVRMRQLAKVARLDRDKGMRGDGFEWAVHEAILGKEPRVLDPLAYALRKASAFIKDAEPTSLMFGHERARYLGFLDAVVQDAGNDAYLLPEGSGRPFRFGHWVATAAQGQAAEPHLAPRIKKIWKTDVFLSARDDPRYFATTIKSNLAHLEGGAGLRIGIVPESAHVPEWSGVRYSQDHKLWVVTLADPNGFMGLFNDGYNAMARAICTLGKHTPPVSYTKPSAKAGRMQEQVEKYPDATALEVEAALNDAAQQGLVTTEARLVSVNAPGWLHMKTLAPKLISPKPKFHKL